MSHFRVFRFPRARFSRVDFWQNWYVLQQKMIKKSNNPEVLTSNTWATKKRNCINKTLTALAVIIHRTLRLLTFFTSLSSLIHPHFLNGNYSTYMWRHCGILTSTQRATNWRNKKRQMTSMEVNIPLFLKSKPNSPNSFLTFWSSHQIKMSHSIHMSSIQIDTKSLELIIQYQFNNIKLSFFASHIKRSFPLCMVIWLKITQNVAFEFFIFGIFHHFLSYWNWPIWLHCLPT